MNVSEIIRDSLRYPFSDWKRYLLFGFILLISISSINLLFSIPKRYADASLILVILTVIALISTILGRGYYFRVLKYSLNGMEELPNFNNWKDMLKDGIKLSIVTIIYLIPFTLIIISLKASIISILFVISSTLPGLVYNLGLADYVPINLNISLGLLLGYLYLNIALPLSLLSIANMADNNRKIKDAFKFHQIINKVTKIGWKKLLIWYILTEIIFLTIFSFGYLIITLISFDSVIGIILISLILTPYLDIYLYRSVALFYKS